jgi:hypothetical protein
MQYIYIYILLPASYQNHQYLFQDMLLLTHYLSLIFLRAWQKFIAEKEGEFNPTITFYTDYQVRNPNNNFRFEPTCDLNLTHLHFITFSPIHISV